MESRRQRPASTQSLRKKTKAKSATPAWSLPNIAHLTSAVTQHRPMMVT